MSRTIKATLVKALGLLLTLVGLIIFILPLPLGLPITAVGLVMLISSSRTARRVVRYLRIRLGFVDRMFTLFETRGPTFTRGILRKTRRRIIGRKAAI